MGNSLLVRKSTITFYISLFCLASYAMLENMSISIAEFTVYKRPLLIVGAICLLKQFVVVAHRFLHREYFGELLVAFTFIVSIIAAMINTKSSSYSPLFSTINFSLFFIECIALMIFVAENGYAQRTFDFLFYYALILAVITDTIMFTGIANFTDGMFETYLVGTKFSISYLHIYLLAFYLLRKRVYFNFRFRYIFLTAVFAILVIQLALKVDCNTGMIGCVLLIAMVWAFNSFSGKLYGKFTSPWIFSVFLLGSVLVAFILESLVLIPSVSDFIVNVLNRNTTLTGRTDIFTSFIPQMSGHWLWGYGLGNSYSTSMRLFGYADAQNALLQWILQIGIVGTFLMCLFFVLIIRRISKKEDKMQIMPLLALVYVFIILGTVEITISMNFVFWMMILFMWGHSRIRKGIGI